MNWEEEYRKRNWCNGRKITFYYVDFKGEVVGKETSSTQIKLSKTTLVMDVVTKEPQSHFS